MRDRRFVLLAGVLVVLNAVLWLAPGAFGLSQVVVQSLVGKNMVRADITEIRGCPAACVEWRLDRGVVASNAVGVLTLNEADRKVQQITVASSTKVTGVGVAVGRPLKANGIKPGWRVLVAWHASGGPAVSIVIERRGRSGSSSLPASSPR